MCENELWCPECGLREGNLDIEERDNRSIIARLKYMPGLKSCSFDSQSTRFILFIKNGSCIEKFHITVVCIVCELVGFWSGRSYFIFHF